MPRHPAMRRQPISVALNGCRRPTSLTGRAQTRLAQTRPSLPRHALTVPSHGASPSPRTSRPAPQPPPAPSPRRPEPTIYALSTAPGRGAIAIVRLSGPACTAVYRQLCPARPDLPPPRRAVARALHDPRDPANVLDPAALVLSFPGPRSVTGEDVLELHVHGGPATVRAVLGALAALGGGHRPDGRRAGTAGAETLPREASLDLRCAEPGEFTRRAFARGRLDLAAVEALGAALAAETEAQRRAALAGGGLGRLYDAWRARLAGAQAALEALIDFSEDHALHDAEGENGGDDDGTRAALAGVARDAAALRAAMARAGRNAGRGEVLRRGARVALLGRPNAGKSALLNAVAGREAAIVSAEAGTTRDVVEVSVDVGGYLVRLWDLAGIRGAGEDVGAVEREGMRRARERVVEADVVLAVVPGPDVVGPDGQRPLLPLRIRHANDEVRRIREAARAAGTPVLQVYSKSDLLPSPPSSQPWAHLERAPADGGLDRVYPVSCKPGAAAGGDAAGEDGLEALLKGLTATLGQLTAAEAVGGGSDAAAPADRWEETLGATHRQRQLLAEAEARLAAFAAKVAPEAGTPLDLAICAEDLRAAADCMAKITGTGDVGSVEEILGVVFEKFCVGK